MRNPPLFEHVETIAEWFRQRGVIFPNPFVQVLVQECIRYNKLIDIMEQSLPELQKALKGLVVMSGELEAVGKAIALNAVPESWEAKVNPTFLNDYPS